MRRIALLCAALLLAAPAAASAAITPTRDAGALAGAIADSGGVTGAAFNPDAAGAPEIPPAGNPHAVADSALTGFPLQGSTYAILTTGDAELVDDPNTSESSGADDGGPQGHGVPPNPGNAFDTTVLRLDLNVPAPANCLSFSFRFFSEEFEENVGGSVNDGFIAELDATNWTTEPNGDISAPGNFAFDAGGNVISVNTSGMSLAEAAGTTYDGATPRLNAAREVTSGSHSLYLSIFDQGDRILDSAVFLDRLTFLTTQPGGCVPGATQDTEAPAVSIGSPGSTTDTTPTLSGGAGTAPGDSSTVTVRVLSGGSVVQTLTTTASGGSWSVEAGPLGPGEYTAQAEQSDAAGNTGTSSTSFTITAPPPPPPPPPPPAPALQPDLGESVVAGTVSGTVRVRGPDGRFRLLGPGEEIPLGSVVDARRGVVRLTSAADPSGTPQSADFSLGQFRVTQSRTGLTQLALTGGSFAACPRAGRASSSQRRKRTVRRLFGDGRGKFRTRGRHGAATVRGTRWSTEDRCDGTYFRAQQGSLTIRDFTRRRTVTLKRGRTYRAPARRRR